MSYEDILRLALEHGYFFPSAELYGNAPAGFWDYGPLGVSLRNQFIDLWRRLLVRRDQMLEIDGSQILPRDVFVASGHLTSFQDPMAQCTRCHTIVRADRYVQERLGTLTPEKIPLAALDRLIHQHQIRCPKCRGPFAPTTYFPLMFQLRVGAGGDEAYLRPETAQSIFLAFPRLAKTMRLSLPVALAQYGKSFRNEIAPRQSLIRLREFYQAEIEVFFNPRTAARHPRFPEVAEHPLPLAPSSDLRSEAAPPRLTCREAVAQGLIPNELIAYYLALLHQFYVATGLDPQRLRFRPLTDAERAFYAANAFDFEVHTHLGWLEVVACNYRTDYDLRRHGEVSKTPIHVLDQGEPVIPHVFELSLGVDHSLYCLLDHAYTREPARTVLRLRPYLAPIQLSVAPLVRKDPLPAAAQRVHRQLQLDFTTFYDEAGSIGRRYRRMDEVGTPYNVTVDHQTLRDDTVTLRHRDTMSQERLPIAALPARLRTLTAAPAL